jgi:hypothetical protein
MEVQAFLIRLLFAHCTNGSLLFVRLLAKKQTEVIVCNRTKRSCPSMSIVLFPSLRAVVGVPL